MGQGGGGGAVPSFGTLADAFAADGCTQPWYWSATFPNAKRHIGQNKTIIAWEAWVKSLREIHTKIFDNATKAWGKTNFVTNDTLADDDHGVPSHEWDADGYHWIFGGIHNANMKVWRSNSADYGASGLYTEQTSIVGKYAYPHPFFVGGKMYVFMRKDDTAANGRYPLALVIGTPTAGTMAWGSEIVIGDLATDSRFYMGGAFVSGTDVYISFTRANAGDDYRQNLYCLVYHTADGSVSNLAGTTTIAATSFPILRTTWDASFMLVDQVTNSLGGNVPAMCLATDGHVHLHYMQGARQGGVYSLYHRVWDGSTLSAATKTGDTSGNGDDTNRYNAMSVGPLANGDVELGFFTNPASGAIARGGDFNRMTRTAAGVFSAATIIRKTGLVNTLNLAVNVLDGGDELSTIFAETTLSDPTIESGLLKCLALDKTGAYVGTPYGPDEQAYSVRLSSLPSASVRKAIGDFISTLRDTTDATSGSPLWELIFGIYNFLAQDAASCLINMRQSRFDLTQNGSPVFAGAYKGFTGIANAYWDTGVTLTNWGATLNFGINSAVANNGSANSLLGDASTGNNLFHGWDGTNMVGKISDSGTALTQAFAGAADVIAATRASGVYSEYGRGALLGTKAPTSVALVANNLLINRRLTAYSTATHYLHTIGFSFDAASALVLSNAIKALVNTIGSGISI